MADLLRPGDDFAMILGNRLRFQLQWNLAFFPQQLQGIRLAGRFNCALSNSAGSIEYAVGK